MSFIPLPIDSTSGAAITIAYEHAQIHAGLTFFYADSNTIGSGSSQDYLITTPANKYVHFVFNADGSAITSMYLYEGADRTGTTPQTIYNSNRLSATAASTTVAKGTSAGTTDGTRLVVYSGGTATNQSRSGADFGFAGELILKQSTKYLLRITSGTAGNLCNVNMRWYENS